jgi:hypothetical protein
MAHKKFYDCDEVGCPNGADLARQCAVNPCQHVIAYCKDHGGDPLSIKKIQEHMNGHALAKP